jgi:hypothetical protein
MALVVLLVEVNGEQRVVYGQFELCFCVNYD